MYVMVTTVDRYEELEQFEFCDSCWEKQEEQMIACYVNYDVFELRPSESSYCDDCGARHPLYKEEVYA